MGQFAPTRPAEIIGVVADFVPRSVRDKINPAAFFVDPALFGTLNIKLTGQRIPETLRAIDRIWADTGAAEPIQRIFYDQRVQEFYLDVIREGTMFAAFSLLALFIAGFGLLGLAISNTQRRTKEIGVRKVMGAKTADMVRLLAWDFAKPVLAANLIAWPVAYYFMNRWLAGFAYHVDLEPWMFLGAGAAALVIALVTVSVQSYLTARAKPVAALRYE
jgi:putative ABC transport system permease protein